MLPLVVPNLLRSLLVALAYFAGARLGYAFAVGGTVSLWPPSGLMLGVLALAPMRQWPWLIGGALAGSMASDVMSGYSLPLALFAAAANAFDAGVGAWILRRLVGTPVHLSSLRAVVVLAIGVVIAANAVTVIPGAVMMHVGFNSPLSTGWFAWWVGDGLGMLILTPVILTWTEAIRRRQRVRAVQLFEAALLIAALLAAGATGAWPHACVHPVGTISAVSVDALERFALRPGRLGHLDAVCRLRGDLAHLARRGTLRRFHRRRGRRGSPRPMRSSL